MSNDRERILIVDDSPIDISFVVNVLQKDYALQVAVDGSKAVDITKSGDRPDLILMDVDMPNMNGFEACNAIKTDFDTDDIDIIFLSGLSSIDEKIKGYDAGACDFISKPIEPDELRRKIRIAINNRKKRHSLLEEKNEFFNTAMTAITSAGETGVVLNFTRNLFGIKSINDLAKSFISALGELDLSASVVLKSENGDVFASSIEPISSLEKSLLLQLDRADRIFEKGHRLMFNFRDVNLLIKNSPEDDDKRGRYRDIIAMMLDSVVACHDRLKFEARLELLSDDARLALKKISSDRSKHTKEGEAILQKLLVDLEASFLSWGLTEDQEVILTNMVYEAMDRMEEHTFKGYEIDGGMRTILDRLLEIR